MNHFFVKMGVGLFAILLFPVSVVSAADSISLNFMTELQGGTSTALYPEYSYGVVPVTGPGWNNLVSILGSEATVHNNSGQSYSASLEWKASSSYWTQNAPNVDNHAMLFRGYMDDNDSGDGRAIRIYMDVPYLSYDVYYYPSTDWSNRSFRPVEINGKDYFGASGATVESPDPIGLTEDTGNWGDTNTVNGPSVTLEEGVNYLRITNQVMGRLAVEGKRGPTGSGARGGLGALQVVNTAGTIGTWIDQDWDGNWSSLVWQDDMTGTTTAYSPSNNGLRFLLGGTESTYTMNLGGSGLTTGDLLVFGDKTLEIKNGTLNMGGTGTIYTRAGANLVLGDVEIQMGIFDTITAAGNISFGSGTFLDIFATGDGLTDGDIFLLFLTDDSGTISGWENLQMTTETLKYWEFVAGTPGAVTYLGGLTPSENGGVPEPATWGMMVLGLMGMACAYRFRRRG